MSARGRWFVTPHAIQRYAERVRGGIRYEQALAELVAQSERAHFVKAKRDGAELWRGPKPLRLRFVVAPPRLPGQMPALVTVETEHDGASSI